MQATEKSKTRVAGWEEPCHPGSACGAHSNPLPPTMQPDSHPLSHHGLPRASRRAKTPVNTGLKAVGGGGPVHSSRVHTRVHFAGLKARLQSAPSSVRAVCRLPRSGAGAGVQHRELQDQPGTAIGRARDQASSVGGGDGGGDREPAAVLAAAHARAPDQQIHRGREPAPSSITSSTARGGRRRASTSARTRTVSPPWRIALPIRFPAAWARRRRSPHIRTLGPAHCQRSSLPAAVAAGCPASTASSTSSRRSTGARRSRCGPGVRAPCRSSSAREARPSSVSIARSRAADSSPRREPSSRPRRAAVIGPRSSGHARATASMRVPSARRAPSAIASVTTAVAHPASAAVCVIRPARRR